MKVLLYNCFYFIWETEDKVTSWDRGRRWQSQHSLTQLQKIKTDMVKFLIENHPGKCGITVDIHCWDLVVDGDHYGTSAEKSKQLFLALSSCLCAIKTQKHMTWEFQHGDITQRTLSKWGQKIRKKRVEMIHHGLNFTKKEGKWEVLFNKAKVESEKKWKWSCSVVSNSLWPYGLQPARLLRS